MVQPWQGHDDIGAGGGGLPRQELLFRAMATDVREVVVAIRDWVLGQMRLDMERVAPLIEGKIAV